MQKWSKSTFKLQNCSHFCTACLQAIKSPTILDFLTSIHDQSIKDSVSNGIVGATFACILAEQFKNLKRGDRFFFTHKESGQIRQERGWSKNERKESQIQSRRLSDIMCDNMDIETIPEYVFKTDSGLMKCKEKSKLLVSRNYASSS